MRNMQYGFQKNCLYSRFCVVLESFPFLLSVGVYNLIRRGKTIKYGEAILLQQSVYLFWHYHLACLVVLLAKKKNYQIPLNLILNLALFLLTVAFSLGVNGLFLFCFVFCCFFRVTGASYAYTTVFFVHPNQKPACLQEK